MAAAERLQGLNFRKIGERIPRVPSRWVARALLAAGVATTTFGITDIVMEQPAYDRFYGDLRQKYPLVSENDLETSKNKVAAFEKKERELIVNGQAVQIPQLVAETGVRVDYTVIDQQKENLNKRTELDENSEYLWTTLRDGMLIPIGGIVFMSGMLVNKSRREIRRRISRKRK